MRLSLAAKHAYATRRVRHIAAIVAASCLAIYLVAIKGSKSEDGAALPAGTGAQAVYVHSAIVSGLSRSLSIYYVSACDNAHALHVRLRRADGQVAHLTGKAEATNAGCPWHYARTCTWGGFMWTANEKVHAGTNVTGIELQMRLQPKNTTGFHREAQWMPGPAIRVNAVAQGQREQSTMAVCIQPVFMLTDWPAVARFIELWRRAGAQHFFVYMQSSSEDVRRLLDAYEADGIVTLINWSKLPVLEQGYDPNEKVYRADIFTAINECLDMTRGKFKYTALVDWDEIVVANGSGIVDYLDRHSDGAVGAVAFRSVIVTPMETGGTGTVDDSAPSTWSHMNITRMSMFMQNSVVFPHGRQGKLIVRPERIGKMHVHEVLRMMPRAHANDTATTTSEQGKGKADKKPAKYEIYYAAENEGLLLHMRKVVTASFAVSNRTEQLGLVPMAKDADALWPAFVSRHRLDAAAPLPTRSESVVRRLESCKQTVLVRHDAAVQQCFAVPALCQHMVVDLNRWRFEPNAWTVLLPPAVDAHAWRRRLHAVNE